MYLLQGHTWRCAITQEYVDANSPQIIGSTNITFDPYTATASFELKLDKPGKASLVMEVKSSPPDFSFTSSGTVTAYPSGYSAPVESSSKVAVLTLDGDFDAVVKGKEDYFKKAVYNLLQPLNYRVNLKSIKLTKGEI